MESIIAAGSAILTGCLYAGSTTLAGYFLLARHARGDWAYCIPLSFALGVCAYSLMILGFALLGVMVPMVSWGLMAAPWLALAFLGWRHGFRTLFPDRSNPLPCNTSQSCPANAEMGTASIPRGRIEFGVSLALVSIIVLYAFYALAQALSPHYYGDINNYHLVVIRDIAQTGRFEHNLFLHDSGQPYGWQVFTVPAFMMGGEHAVKFLGVLTFLLAGLLIWSVTSPYLGRIERLVMIAAFGIMSVNLLRSGIVNNDLPLFLFELLALTLALKGASTRGDAIRWAMLAGFLTAIKLTAAFGLLLITLIYLWQTRHRFTLIALSGCLALGICMIWPVLAILQTGSALPQYALSTLFSATYKPFYVEAITFHIEQSSIYHMENLARFFTGPLLLFPVMMTGIVFMPLIRNKAILSCAILLLGYALLRWGGSALLSGTPALLWHDRYHLISAVLIACLGAYGFSQAMIRLPRTYAKVAALPVAFVVAWLLYGNWLGQHVHAVPLGDGAFREETHPSLLHGLKDSTARIGRPTAGGPHGSMYDWVSRNLPENALLATTNVDTYLFKRQALQVLPASQNAIDLDAEPAELLDQLQSLGVSHIHLSLYSGLPVWMNPLIDLALANYRAMADLDRVELLFHRDQPEGHGPETVYIIRDRPSSPLWSGDLGEIRTWKEDIGYHRVLVNWDNAPGIPVDIDVRWPGGAEDFSLIARAGPQTREVVLNGLPRAQSLEFRLRPTGLDESAHRFVTLLHE